MNTHRRHYFDSTDCIIGIDPGSNGGIATWRPEHPVLTSKMPKDLNDLKEYLQYVKGVCAQPIVFLEKVQLRTDDIKDNPGKAFRIQQLLMQFQKLKDYIEVENVPYVMIHPMSWQTTLKLRTQKTETKTERKNRYKAAAEHYYPGLKATLWNADAVLIMHAGRYKLQNEPDWVLANLPAYIKNGMFPNEPK